MIIHCDGCRKKDGRGGWGVVIESQGRIQCFGMGYKDTTNNRMEMMGPLFLLEYLHKKGLKGFTFYSDSQYVVKGFNNWMHGWKYYNWNKKSPGPILNLDLWKQLYEFQQLTKAKARWVKGHSTSANNELADLIANYSCRYQAISNMTFRDLKEAIDQLKIAQ